jgi:hypothetical protein
MAQPRPPHTFYLMRNRPGVSAFPSLLSKCHLPNRVVLVSMRPPSCHILRCFTRPVPVKSALYVIAFPPEGACLRLLAKES